MKISLNDAGKRFNREWIFRNANISFEAAHPTAITGANGSGKSTLLQCIGGMMELSEGKIEYEGYNNETIYKNISFCAPYLELIEEMTMKEFLSFHAAFKPFLKEFTVHAIINEIGLNEAKEKQLRNFSSGMKQRVKLAQAIFSDTDIVLLDEPCSNLDEQGIALYHQLIQKYCCERLVIVCSNDPVEYNFCKRTVSMVEFK
ncbi:MAG: ABC transporter ATP-binding protein [Flavisolibacter sp.]|jgi:ABC-type multidrug transport system ATPase subunit|nr:ABC transporter ATP-binding protein [Flavisolibacter sp.]